MSNIDIEPVNLNLMKTLEHGSTYRILQKRVMINFIKEACGWGGEVKFQNYSEWNYNNYFEVVDQRWFEMKFLENYSSGMDLQNKYFALDSLYSLYCFCECEDGLWRRHLKYQIAIFVFQYQHSRRYNVISTIITRSIRCHLYKNLPKKKNHVFTSKFLCIAFITKWHPTGL